MTSGDLWRLGAAEALAALNRREVSATELLEACLSRIDDLDPSLHSFITVCGTARTRKPKRATCAAMRGSPFARWRGFLSRSRTSPTPQGVRTTYGSLPFRDHVPTRDELCIQRLRDAGAILVGKTNTPEFGFGPRSVNRLAASTANPHDLSLSAGGSSGGSAAAVAAGLVPFAHGTDFGGSVRTPAAFCGNRRPATDAGPYPLRVQGRWPGTRSRPMACSPATPRTRR